MHRTPFFLRRPAAARAKSIRLRGGHAA